MSLITLDEVKLLYPVGALNDWHIEKAAFDGWHIAIRKHDGWSYLRTQREESPRLFHSLDAAASLLEKLGFELKVLKPLR